MFDAPKIRAMLRQAQANPAQAGPLLSTIDQAIKLGPHPNRILEGPARTGATLLIRPPDPAAALTPNTTSAAQPFTFRLPKGGRVLAAYGQVGSGLDSDMASVSVQILKGGEKSIITNGDANAWIPALAAFGQVHNWLPLNVEVVSGEVWTVAWKHEGYTNTNIQPSLLLTVLSYDPNA